MKRLIQTAAAMLLIPLASVSVAGERTALKNAGFESLNALEGWMPITYGPSARIALDGEVVHEGRQSLRVSAEEASDVALGQELAVEPKRSIERIDPSDCAGRHHSRFPAAERINPYQYGQFIEYLCTMVPAMWAEKLFDGSFEGLSPYKVAYLKETDFRERPWYPSGATNRATLRSRPLDQGQRRTVLQDRRGRRDALHGLDRAGWDRHRAGPGLRLRLLSEAERRSRERCACGCTAMRSFTPRPSSSATGEWAKVSRAARAVSNRRQRHAHDRVSRAGHALARQRVAHAGGRHGGWRADVVEAVKAMRPGSSASAAARSTTRTWASSSGETRSATRTTAGRSAPGAAFSRPGRASKSSSSSAGWSTPSR